MLTEILKPNKERVKFYLPQERRRESHEGAKDGHNSSLDWEEDNSEHEAFEFRKPDHPVRSRYSTDSNEFAGFSESSGSESKKDKKLEHAKMERLSDVSLGSGNRKRSIAFVDTSPATGPTRRKSICSNDNHQGTGLTMELSDMMLGKDKRTGTQELGWDSGEEADVSMADSSAEIKSEDDMEVMKQGDETPQVTGAQVKTSSPKRQVSFEFDKSMEPMTLGTPGIESGNNPEVADDIAGESQDQVYELKSSIHSSLGKSGSLKQLKQFRKRMSWDSKNFSFGPSDHSSPSSIEQMRRRSVLRPSPLAMSPADMSCDITPANQKAFSRQAQDSPVPFVSIYQLIIRQ